MRLSTIKLAGFKSFVDPTTLHLPTNMTGVVGPNGCGKSNIIDAVRWVMGESTASRLRGDSLTDVIFSGSSARKPVSQATVELIFDNADHTITGEFGAFDEISVKRSVGRDGQGSYYLNGGKCRRRDITDLFLGTGLGPRSYSIIEQGMISRIIDARPEELRVYLEEAAGISKYKERRRETETRIRHTRENLERLSDLRDEVGKQLEHLKRQARQAEQYAGIQTERKLKDAQWKALQYRALETQLQQVRQTLARDDTRLQQLIAEQREAERLIETERIRRDEGNDALNAAQATVYEVSGALARIEQQITHQQEMAERLNRARDEAQSSLAEIGTHISGDEARLGMLREAIAETEPQLQQLQAGDQHCQDALDTAESTFADWQHGWDAHSHAQAEAARAADVERTRVDYLDRQALDAERRREQLDQEHAGLDVAALAATYSDIQSRHDTRKATLDSLSKDLDARKHAVTELQDQQRIAQTELAAVREQTQEKRGRLASLQALQSAALGQEQTAAIDWLRGHGLEKAARVGEKLAVEPGWENAVEAALGQFVEGVLVEGVPVEAAAATIDNATINALRELHEGRLTLVATQDDEIVCPASSLAAKVRGPAAIRRILSAQYGVETLADAQALLPSLGAGESAVTRAGERLGVGWVQVSRLSAAKHGALLREREIQALGAEVAQLQHREAELERGLAAWRDRALVAEQQREQAQRAVHLAHREVSELAGRLQSQQGRLESAHTRIGRIQEETSQLAEILESSTKQAREARARLDAAVSQMAALESERETLQAERDRIAQARDTTREAARASAGRAHALALTVETQRAQIAALAQSLERMDGQRGQLDSRLQELGTQLSDGNSPLAGLESQRQQALEARLLRDTALGEARSAVDTIDERLRSLEQTRQQRDEQALSQREAISQRKLEQQAVVIQAEQLVKAVAENGMSMDEVVAGLSEDAQIAVWEKAVMDFDAKLRRLEPVNLAAIAEHAEAAQRKQYLDAQDADLNTALETLETAIRKIDRETRGRFKDTFDRVNSGVQALYPRLFGGGHAYLELTGEDLLDTGVSIMARPPGKRVSNISLLSGGEKAMTAVALVFAIFRLNPAPFCLLDEVDAPLDEANIDRFTALVDEMSAQVQFLFVTHNKATMEAARQLSGVTMREPGVSRLVSVDLDEAARLAGAA